MAKIVAVVNQKGGVAKTTTTVNLGTAVAMAERRVLIVDMDPQANSTSGLGLQKYAAIPDIYHCIVEGKSSGSAIHDTSIDFLKIIPANKNLVGAELELVDEPDREFRLRSALEPLRSSFDYIFIDAPPSLGLLTVNAMVAADQLLIPVQAEYYALEGVSELLDTMQRIRQAFNPALAINGFLLTMVDDRTNLSSQVEAEVRQAFGKLVYEAIIPRNIRIAESPSFGKPVLLYDLSSKGSLAYLKLAKEFMAHDQT